MAYTDQEVEQRLKDEAQKRGVTYDDSDLQDVRHRDNSDAGIDAALKKMDYRSNNQANSDQDNNDGRANPWSGGGGAGASGSTTSQWNMSGGGSGSDGSANDILAQMRSEMQAREAADAGRRDSLYTTLDTRAKQSLNIDPNDPVIKAQTDAYGADQERARRNYLSDIAERSGPDANLRGEQRMASEKVGQATSGFRAKLMGDELTARRSEIADSLNSMRGILTADQQAQLEQELAILDNSIKQQGIGIQQQGLDQDWRKALLQNEQFNNNLGFNYWDRANYYDTEALR